MELRSVSASQVESFDRCIRYWYNRSILKLPTPQTPQQKRGQDIHAAVENYLRHGTIDPEWASKVELARKHLPEPGSKDVRIEQKIELATYEGGPPWIGYIDLLDIRRLPVKISDHKTIGNFRYMKTKAELMVNTQLMSYAKWVTILVDHPEVELEHIYIGTKEEKSAVVSITVNKNHIDSIWNRDVEKVKQMAEVARSAPITAESLPGNYAACGMYGGCPYRDRCKDVSPFRGRSDSMSNVPPEASVILQRLALAANGAVAAAAAPVAAAPVAPVAVAAPVVAAPVPVVAAAAVSPDVRKAVMTERLKSSIVGTTVYEGGFGYTKLPDGQVFEVAMAPEDYARAVAAQSGVPAVVAAPVVAAPVAVAAPVVAAPAPEAAAPVVVAPVAAAAPAEVVAAAAPASSLLGRLQAANAATAAPFLAAAPGDGPQVIPPDAPPRTSTDAEVKMAEGNNGQVAEKAKRGRPRGTTNAKEVVDGFTQLLFNDGELFGLDGNGQIWVMKMSDVGVWARLPMPNFG